MARKGLPAETWDEIERRWRMGASEAQLSAEFEVSRKAISNKRAAGAWVRDLKGQYREAVLTKVAANVACEVAGATNVQAIAADPSTMDASVGADAASLEALSELASRVLGQHRSGAHRGRNVVATLYSQLEYAIENRGAIEEQIIAETAAADDPESPDYGARAARAQMMRAVSLPQHAVVLKDISVALKNFVLIERQALGLEDDKPKGPPPAQYVFNLNMRGRGRDPRTIDG